MGNRNDHPFHHVSLGVFASGSGPFSVDEWRDTSPYDAGSADQVTMYLSLNNFKYGDTLSMPGSLGANIEVAATPEPASCVLLISSMLFLGLASRALEKYLTETGIAATLTGVLSAKLLKSMARHHPTRSS